MRIISIACLIACMATGGRAGPGLGQEPRVTEGLIAVAIAYEIGQVCPDLSARRWRGISYLMQLRGVARDLGYSRREIDDFIADRAEKSRLEGIARQRLADMGARRGDAASHCHVGRRAMAERSVIGQLLTD